MTAASIPALGALVPAFPSSMLRAYPRRAATGDVEALTLMTDLASKADAATGQAVTGLREFGCSRAETGRIINQRASGP